MRRVVVVIVLVGCTQPGREGADASPADATIDAMEAPCEIEGRTYAGTETWMVECTACRCRDGQPWCTIAFCGSPNGDEGASCAREAQCAGPMCGSGCCRVGERCNGFSCVCGDRDLVCTPLETCGVLPDTCGGQCVPFGSDLRETPTRITGQRGR